MAILLQASNISKSYGVRTVLSNISLQIQERERIGLVGVNGAGKSTLLQIISGEMSFDSGDIFKAKETKIGYLAQNSGLRSNNTIWNEMLDVFTPLIEAEQELREMEAAMADPSVHQDDHKYQDLLHKYAVRSDWFREHGGYETESRIRSVLHGLGFGNLPHDTLISTLSGGQKTRLALAKMLLKQPDLLMLDEPTNHLDIATLTWLEDYLRSYPGAILVVSHDRYFLDSLVHTIYEIERHRSKRYTGNYSRYVQQKAAEYESRLKEYEKQQEEISRMEDFIQRNIVRATTTKRAQSRRKALERMERIERPLGELKKASFSFEIAKQSGSEVLHVSDLSVSYDGKRPLFQHAAFDLTRGETVALIGPNGIGKSTLLRVLVGDLQPFQGSFQWGTNVQIGYYDQEQTGLSPNNSVLDEVWNTYPHLEEARIRTVLGNFLFSGEDVFKKVTALSGGEKARVALAKLMLQNANVLILDEPTNHLDLFSKEVLEAALMDYEGTLLFISHDRYFLNKMSERIIELNADGTESYLGNYDDYMEKKLELAAFRAELEALPGKPSLKATLPKETVESAAVSSGKGGSAETTKAPDYKAEKQAKREERSRQRKLEQLEQDIARLEDEIGAFEEKLTSPEIYNDYIKVQEVNAAIEERKTELQTAYEAWETLME